MNKMATYWLVTEYDTGDEIVRDAVSFAAESDEEALKKAGDVCDRHDWAAYCTGLNQTVSYVWGKPYGGRTIKDPLV